MPSATACDAITCVAREPASTPRRPHILRRTQQYIKQNNDALRTPHGCNPAACQRISTRTHNGIAQYSCGPGRCLRRRAAWPPPRDCYATLSFTLRQSKVGTFEESRIFKILRFKNIQAVRLKNLEESVWNTSWSLWAHGRKCEAHARTHHKNLTSILSPGQRVYTPDPFGTCSDREYLWIPG